MHRMTWQTFNYSIDHPMRTVEYISISTDDLHFGSVIHVVDKEFI